MTQPESLLSERRNHRQIQLDSDEPAPVGKFYDKQVKDTKRGTIITERFRDGDCMVIKTSEDLRYRGPHGEETHTSNSIITIPIHINFEWIKKQAVIESDDDHGMPWNDCDGWEHTLEGYDAFGGSREHFRQTRGYVTVDCIGHLARVVITDMSFGGESPAARLAYFRAKGASKQVARELVAAAHRRYIDQIVAWYVDGYHCSFVKIEFELGGKTYEDSCGNVEEAYAEDRSENGFVYEMAGNITRSLERDGFVVVGAPVRDHKTNRMAERRRRFAHNISLFDWRD